MNSKFYDNSFLESIKKKIDDGDFTSKEELANYLKSNPDVIRSNPDFVQKLEENKIELNVDDLNELASQLLDYYDKKMVDTTSLNLDNVTSLDINGKEYLKVANEDGTYTVLDNNMSKNDFVTEFKDRQNASMDYQTIDGIENREQIIDEMRKEKEEVNLESDLNVDKRELTDEEKREFAAVMGLSDINVNNFLVDPSRNIYINKDTGETYYTSRNSFDQLEVRRADEKGATTVATDVETVNEMGDSTEVTVETPEEPVESPSISDDEIIDTYNSSYDSLSSEQKERFDQIISERNLKERIEERKKQEAEEIKQQEVATNGSMDYINKPKQKVLVMKDLTKEYNGFTSILFICLLTSVYGISLLLYLLITNGFFK